MTVARQWSWKPNDDVKSLRQCLQALVRTVGGDGNFLFNISPDFTGRVEPEQVARLKEMGQWLEKYGYSVYGTRGGPFKPTDWGVSTRKGNKIYLHIMVWSGNKVQITLPDMGMEIKNCRLANGTPVKLTKKDKGYSIEFSAKALQPINTIVEIEVAGNAMDIKPLEIKAQSLSFRKQASASSVGDKTWHGIRLITNGDWSGYGWSPAKDDKMSWAEVDLEKPQIVSKAIVAECGKAVKAFEIQYLSGETWKTAYKGTSIQSGVEFSFPKITAQKVRLVITETSAMPEITEIVLF
jgi:alpha-L-fucosidase